VHFIDPLFFLSLDPPFLFFSLPLPFACCFFRTFPFLTDPAADTPPACFAPPCPATFFFQTLPYGVSSSFPGVHSRTFFFSLTSLSYFFFFFFLWFSLKVSGSPHLPILVPFDPSPSLLIAPSLCFFALPFFVFFSRFKSGHSGLLLRFLRDSTSF